MSTLKKAPPLKLAHHYCKNDIEFIILENIFDDFKSCYSYSCITLDNKSTRRKELIESNLIPLMVNLLDKISGMKRLYFPASAQKKQIILIISAINNSGNLHSIEYSNIYIKCVSSLQENMYLDIDNLKKYYYYYPENTHEIAINREKTSNELKNFLSFSNIFSFKLLPAINLCGTAVSTAFTNCLGKELHYELYIFKQEISRIFGFSSLMITDKISRNSSLYKDYGMKVIDTFRNHRSGNDVIILNKVIENPFEFKSIKTEEASIDNKKRSKIS